MRAYVDADILIWQLRDEPRAVTLFTNLVQHGDSLWTGANQKVEILFHIKPGEEHRTRELLDLVATHPLDDFVIALGADLYRQWAPAHGVGRNDALLAASAMLGGGVVYTLNTRHYPMPGIEVVRAW